MGSYTEVAEAAEHHKHSGGSRWTPIAAAVVAVLAAMATLLSNQRATASLIAKNDAIVSVTHASDTYNYYQAKSIKEDVYLAALASSGKPNAAMRKIVDHENSSKQTVLAKAREYERQAGEDEARSEKLLHSYETLEIGVTFLEVGIVILSISAIAGTVALPVIAIAATITGLGFAIAGLPV